ncbi:PTS sugar transporter subunit IIA [Vagococcus humatus]|uniref:PTS N-acetylgalactosamine IIA subunit n=1 Tax=Vagococcus humatus TaxID=1889241 RepID=A0A429Z6A5_9ENTE|nr:PTS N-acetylgalactosamine IIA subunit [Vagococcus humatus]RST89184.1 PTS N-acetylgalactosamine IIA subunit [Vagococcus humatus]
MLGMMITGHGEFSVGMKQALEMIAGEQVFCEAVPFFEDMELEAFNLKIFETIKQLKEQTDGVLVFSDLKGGTPFNVSMLAISEIADTAMLTGVNLPTLIEGSMLRLTETDPVALAKILMNTGREGLEQVDFPVKREETEQEIGGI